MTPPATTSIDYGGLVLTLEHPSDWHYTHAFDGSLGPSFEIGYMSAHVEVHRFVPQCTTTARTSKCTTGGPYVTSLPKGAVFISFHIANTLNRPTERPDQIVSGYPAYIEKATAGQCPRGSTSGLIVSIYAHAPGAIPPTRYLVFDFQACASTPGTVKALYAMVQTATLTTR